MRTKHIANDQETYGLLPITIMDPELPGLRGPVGHLFVLHLSAWMHPSANSIARAELQRSAPSARVRTIEYLGRAGTRNDLSQKRMEWNVRTSCDTPQLINSIMLFLKSTLHRSTRPSTEETA